MYTGFLVVQIFHKVSTMITIEFFPSLLKVFQNLQLNQMA